MKEEQAPYIAASSYIYNTLHAFHNPEHNFVRDSFLTDLILTGPDGGQDCSTMPTNNLRIVDFAQRLESTNQNKNYHKAYYTLSLFSLLSDACHKKFHLVHEMQNVIFNLANTLQKIN